jgi:hypothetical protein
LAQIFLQIKDLDFSFSLMTETLEPFSIRSRDDKFLDLNRKGSSIQSHIQRNFASASCRQTGKREIVLAGKITATI